MRSHARWLALLIAVGGALGVLGVTRPASAEEIFPGVIQKDYGGTCAAQCTLCHTRPEGGPGYYKPSMLDDGYVVKDLGNNRGQGEFFANLIAVNGGHLPNGQAAMEGALTKLSKNMCSATSTGPCDSDGDGTPDMQEFKKDGDPDVANGELCLGPTYGCGAMIKPLPPRPDAKAAAASVVALLGVGLVFARRLRR